MSIKISINGKPCRPFAGILTNIIEIQCICDGWKVGLRLMPRFGYRMMVIR